VLASRKVEVVFSVYTDSSGTFLVSSNTWSRQPFSNSSGSIKQQPETNTLEIIRKKYRPFI
jgi:hypothetical protein